jgi:hypothetical protein
VSFLGSQEDVTDATLQALLPVKEHVVELDLARTRIDDGAGTVLAQLPRLLRLDLRETAAGDKTVLAIAALGRLQSLNLFGTKVTDDGAKSLAGCASLRQIYLWQTAVSAQAVVALGEKLPQARIVFAPDMPEPAAEDGNKRRRRGGK